jgi:general secretion pathway protein M
MAIAASLPTGRRGQALALATTLVVLAVLWLGVVQPLWSFYDNRLETLQERRALLGRMVALADTLPALKREATAAAEAAPAPQALFEGSSDAIAGAALQEALQRMASQAGAALTSVEALPGQRAGDLRRIGLLVTLSATWPVIVHLLAAIDEASPRMLVDDVSLQGSVIQIHPGEQKLEARFTLYAFRSGQEPTQ